MCIRDRLTIVHKNGNVHTYFLPAAQWTAILTPFNNTLAPTNDQKKDQAQVIIPTQSTCCHVFNDVTMAACWCKPRSDSVKDRESISCAMCTYNTINVTKCPTVSNNTVEPPASINTSCLDHWHVSRSQPLHETQLLSNNVKVVIWDDWLLVFVLWSPVTPRIFCHI